MSEVPIFADAVEKKGCNGFHGKGKFHEEQTDGLWKRRITRRHRASLLDRFCSTPHSMTLLEEQEVEGRVTFRRSLPQLVSNQPDHFRVSDSKEPSDGWTQKRVFQND